MTKTTCPTSKEPLRLLSVVIPARDEQGSIVGAVEHLHVELRLRGIPHEIVVVDDGSTDSTWELLGKLRQNIPAARSGSEQRRERLRKRSGLRHRPQRR